MQIDKEGFEILTRDSIQAVIEANLSQDPAQFALAHSANEFPVAIVATQLKFLQKAEHKLPAYYAARCIIPPRAYEQASSETSAHLKIAEGDSCLDLTCGLGVDSLYLSRQFRHLTALEPDPLRAEIARYNFRRLGATNIAVITTTAESFLAEYNGPPFDLIYLDPDRRPESGKRQHSPQNSQPDVWALMPLLHKHGLQWWAKLSPLYDIAQAQREFPTADRIGVVSVANECKELWLRGKTQPSPEPILELVMARGEHVFRYELPIDPVPGPVPRQHTPQSSYVYEGDVACYKARCLPRFLQQASPEWQGYFNHPEAFFFSEELPDQAMPGRFFKLLQAWPYQPKHLRKHLAAYKGSGLHVLRRQFPFSVAQIRQQCSLSHAGGSQYLLCTTLQKKKWAFLTERIMR